MKNEKNWSLFLKMKFKRILKKTTHAKWFLIAFFVSGCGSQHLKGPNPKKLSIIEEICEDRWEKPDFSPSIESPRELHSQSLFGRKDSSIQAITYDEASVAYKKNNEKGDGHAVHFLMTDLARAVSKVNFSLKCVSKFRPSIAEKSYFKMLETIDTLSSGKLVRVDHSDYEMYYGPDELQVGRDPESRTSTFHLNLASFIDGMPGVRDFNFSRDDAAFKAFYNYTKNEDDYEIRIDFKK